MMRALTLALLLLASACAPRANGCNISFDRTIAFSEAEATDLVTVRTFGDACDKTVGLYTVTSASGHPLWSWTSPMERAFGDIFTGAKPDAMRAFLQRWSQPKIERTAAAPAWPLPESARTTLDRLTYEDIRTRNLPMLCHLIGTALETCVFWEPAAASAGLFYDRDVSGGILQRSGP